MSILIMSDGPIADSFRCKNFVKFRTLRGYSCRYCKNSYSMRKDGYFGAKINIISRHYSHYPVVYRTYIFNNRIFFMKENCFHPEDFKWLS